MEPNPTNPSRPSAHGPDGNGSASSSANSDTATEPPAQLPPVLPANVAAVSTGEGLSSLERLKLFKDRVMATRGSVKEQQQQPPSHQLEKVRVAESFLSQSAPPTPTSPTNGAAESNTHSDPPQVSQAPILPASDEAPVPPTTHNVSSTHSQQQAQPTPPQNGKTADTHEAREHLLKEKLRLKMAQRAAGGDSSGSRAPVTPATAAVAQSPLNHPDKSTANGELCKPREDVEMTDVQAQPNGTNSQASQPPRPRDAAHAEGRPQQRTEPPFDPRKSYAEAARQRFRSYGHRNEFPDDTPAQRPVNRRPPSPPLRRGPSPRREPSPRRGLSECHQSPARPVARTPPLSREPVNPTSHYEWAPPPPEYPDRGRHVDRRQSYSSGLERRLYERQHTQLDEPAGPPLTSYTNDRPREREYERDEHAMPPSGTRAPPAPVVARDNSPPFAANPLEVWAISQVQLLKQQQEGVVKAIAEFEKLISSGILKAAVSAASLARPTTDLLTSTPFRAGNFRQESRPESRPEPRPEQRMEYRMEHHTEQRLEQRPSFSEFCLPPQRESSPGPSLRVYDEPRDRQPLLLRDQPPFVSKGYEYSDTLRSTPKESYGKAPVYKSYDNYNKRKPYDRRPYDRSPADRGPSPTRSQYDSGGRGSWESRAPHPKQYDYRY
ncbi:hypothetical protein CspeluHIS016_0202290 [Cutaneotrichosporon spelunceum]|uniref:Uncharacterized protein n=1 Tax=Cutaneotrichosporon spelunceum TaxID=1672016 RepID=A0AAD3TR29_9TREE|nr:hypothetical protein CspeluHIS016_0202290 [Cutaneotrichosporon spelunceum]